MFSPSKDFFEATLDKLLTLPREKQLRELRLLVELGEQRVIQAYIRYENDLAVRQQVQEIVKGNPQ